ncbi:unnamed protein product [Closterium sp. NIES-54]
MLHTLVNHVMQNSCKNFDCKSPGNLLSHLHASASLCVCLQVDAGLLTSGVMAVYFVFLCWSAIMSEPPAEACNTRPCQTGDSGWLDILVR